MARKAGPADGGALSSFERGLRILVQVAERGEAAAEELALSLDVPLSSVYRYLKTLRSFELVEEHDGRYIPGWKLLELSGQHFAHTRLAEVASTVLLDLVDKTGETAVLTVRVGQQAMCLRQEESRHPLRYAFRINQLLPLYAGAGQRLLLAFAPASVVRGVLAQPPQKYTEGTLTTERLRDDLDRIRRTGVAESHGELTSGAVAIAMPVSAAGEVLGALTLAGPESRCDQRWRKRARRVLLEATRTLGNALEQS